jgi:hypothetical protein
VQRWVILSWDGSSLGGRSEDFGSSLDGVTGGGDSGVGAGAGAGGGSANNLDI